MSSSALETSAQELLAFDEKHLWHPFTQSKLAPKPLLVRKAENEFLYIEDENGEEKKLIDGISSWWVNIHGHNNPAVNDAIKDQLDKFEHAIFAGFTHEPAVKLVEGLLPILPKIDVASSHSRTLEKAFFSDNGSTAVEVAIKMAIQFWHNQGFESKNRIIAFKDSYHGDTVGAMSTSGTGIFFEAFKKILFPVDFVSSPAQSSIKQNAAYRGAFNKHMDAKLGKAKKPEDSKSPSLSPNEMDSLREIETVMQSNNGEVAAVIIEPLVQAAGGMKFHSEAFLQMLRQLCDKYKVILIADEVFTGFGRLGKAFACEKAMIVPDIICLSKGLTGGYLPMGLTVCTQQVYAPFHSDNKMKTFFHGHSYTGNPLSCAAAVASLELFKNENRLEDVDYINIQMERELNSDELWTLGIVKDIRIMGALGVIELDDSSAEGSYLSELGPRLTEEFLRRHILLRPLGNTLYFLPPYTISVKSLDYVLSSIKDVLKTVDEENR